MRHGPVPTPAFEHAQVIDRSMARYLSRLSYGRFRLCYEQGLRKDPTLQGRVTVKFVIDAQGHVSQANDGGSDLPDSDVVVCVLRAFSNLAFPQPDGGGQVTVVYPLTFDPPEAGAKK